MKDYYKVLGVSPDAPAEVIKAAYRALMKVHHPDVGGDEAKAKEIEEAYRNLFAALQPARVSAPSPAGETAGPLRRKASGEAVVYVGSSPVVRGKFLEAQILEVQPNQVFTCPRECSFYRRNCRYKQQLSLESKDLFAFRATTVLVRMRNSAPFTQQIDCRNGRAVIVDQFGDFYSCQNVCSWQHPPKYKEAAVEMFPATQATLMLWYPQLPSGRYLTRFIYKHKVLIRDMQGDWLDEEILELPLMRRKK